MRRLLSCLAAVTFVIGAGLVLTCLFRANRRLTAIGVVYLLAGTALFGVQRGIHGMERHLERRHFRPRLNDEMEELRSRRS